MRVLFLIFFVLFTSNTVFSRVLYVKGQITSDTINNGSSWKHGFIHLQPAMDSAVAGDTIKVSEGMYGRIGFSKDSITLLGGYSFSNGDTTDAKRNWAAYPTKIIGPNRDPVFVQGLFGVTVLDGFFISGFYTHDYGMKVENTTNFIIRNTVFDNHFYSALQIINSSVSIINCVFTQNQRAVLASENSTTEIVNSVFTYNGGSSHPVSNSNSNLSLINCSMVGNNGPFFYGTGTGTSNIRNSIFANNYGRDYGATEDGDIEVNGHQLNISNCITQTYTNASTGRLLTAFNPRFVNIANPAGPDNRYFTADDGLQLSIPCSPALNSGDNSFVGTITTDILGQPRIFNAGTVDMGAYERQSVPGNTLKTVFVKNTGNTGNNDGSSWQNAFPTLQEALLYCADTIKIAEGTYLTTNSRSDSIFYLENKKVLIGGYPAFGNPSDDDRNPSVYITRLEGTFYPTVLATMRSPVLKLYHTDSTTIIDGISFSNGYVDPTTGDVPDALLIDFNSNPVIKNCNFLVNPAKSIFKTGVSIHGQSAPTFLNSRFSAYGSYRGGNAITCTENSTLTIRNSFFLGDSTGIRNTITAKPFISISVTNSTLVMDSTLFWKVPYSGVGNFINSNNSILNIKSSVFRDYLRNNQPLIRNTNRTTGTISNCSFRNDAFDDKPLIYNDNSSPVFNHCLFDSAILMVANVNRSAPVFNNCVSINARFMTNDKSFPTINNSTIVNTFTGSPHVQSELITIRDSSTVRANNSIFWTLKQTGGKQEILNEGFGGSPTAILTNCITRTFGTNGENGNMVGENPRFMQLTDIDGPDNIMFTADDGLQLANCSPAINSGTATGSFFPSDILNQPRIFNNVIDIGAYEFQGQPDLTNSYYVNAASSGNNSGESWTNAYKTLQSAVCNVCADTIRVAGGTYYPATTTRDSAFYIDRPLTMLGGYPASGSPGENLRDAELNPTIIDGNIGNPADSLDNSRGLMIIVGTKDSVVIDGFTFQNGAGSTGGIQINTSTSGGIYTYNNHTVISNCNFFNNTARYGGAISVRPLTTCKITRSIFTNNNATTSGGAIVFSGDSLIISNSVFEKNRSLTQGGAIKIEDGYFKINNTVLYQNFTTINSVLGNGGAIWTGTNGPIGFIDNCTFRENKTNGSMASGGGLFFSDHLRIKIRNCIFSGNGPGAGEQGRFADLNWDGYNIVFQTILQKPRSQTSPLKISYGPANFVDSLNPKGPDQKWMTADDGLVPNYHSAALNFGDNSYVENVPIDLASQPRIIFDSVDAGAYEYQNLPVANAGNDTSICIGSFAQLGKPANPKHTYKWTSDPVGFTSSSTMPEVNPSTVTTYFLEASNGLQTTRDTVVVTPSASLTSSVAITASAASVCQGTSVLFNSTHIHGGAAPSYQWQVNGLPVGSNLSTFSSSTLNPGDQIRVIMTSSSTCATPVANSNTIVINLTPLVTPTVSMSIEPNPVCAGDTVTVVATVTNTGSFPSYTFVIGGVVRQTGPSAVLKIPTTSFTSGSGFFVRLTSSETCVTTSVVTSDLVNVFTTPSITPTAQLFGNTTVVAGQPSFAAVQPVNAGSQPSFQWQENLSADNWQDIANATASSIMYVPVATGHKLRCIVTSSAFCAVPKQAISNTITYIVNVPTGLNTAGRSSLVKLYPNPANNFILLDSLNLNDRWESCVIIGTNARQYSPKIYIGNAKQVRIETNHLIPGLYFAVLQNKEGKKIHLKFVKL